MSNRQSSIARAPKPAFTLVELLVVIFIIAVLVGILIPVVGRVRRSAKSAATQQTIATIAGAIEQYYQAFHAYPGPIANAQIYNTNPANQPLISYAGTPALDKSRITMSENLVLGLLGGLIYDSTKTPTTVYNPDLIGAGPRNLTAANQKTTPSFLPKANLSDGLFKDDADSADDSIIPEFVDNFNSPMPILYLRSNVGAVGIAYDSDVSATPVQQYDLQQIIGYTGTDIGVGRTPEKPNVVNLKVHGLSSCNNTRSLDPTNANYYYPYDLYPYLTNPAIANTPRNKDGFILISAGPDRIYGTDDDICNFGSVK
ncbi:MAG: type II secretion system protein [Phycisphaerales bacterium]|jgi:prepilin-type N-terminal cleavage/methylation domain-containing protein|nr:type II secretion system protein [Phycisphaerales bacterium]